MEEIWKDIPDYEGIYQASNLGRIRSLDRMKRHGEKSKYLFRGGIKSQHVSNFGYYNTSLCKDGKSKTFSVHSLIAITFLGHAPNKYKGLVVNHKNFDKLDNRVENLELITVRENTNMKHIPSASKYTGVTFKKRDQKWQSAIFIGGKTEYLGVFENELDAAKAYQKRLKEIQST